MNKRLIRVCIPVIVSFWTACSSHGTNAFRREIRVQLEKSHVNLESHSDKDWTLLHYALDAGRVDIANRMIAEGVYINTPDDDDTTPLHVTAKKGDLASSKQLVAAGANINARDKRDYTPLGYAQQQEHKELARWFVQKGAITNLDSQRLLGPITRKAADEYYDLAGRMLARGAWAGVNIKPALQKMMYRALDSRKDVFEFVKILLDAGADPNSCHGDNGEPCLQTAISGRHPRAALLLIERGAHLNEEYIGKTPLFVASRYGASEVVSELLKRGVDPNFTPESDSGFGTTPIFSAAMSKDPKPASLLIMHGARVNQRDAQGKTPIFRAAEAGNIETLKLMLEKGAKVNVCNYDKRTPLYYAKKAAVPVLLMHGADESYVCQ